jgi:APA family basic amino acid/polyamine antiporter
MSDPAAPSPRRLGLTIAAALVVANMIGTGIFTFTGFQAASLHDPGTILLLWVVGGVLALCGAASYGELGARMPKAGGEYVYLREAYHPVVGFMSGWVSLTAGFSGPIALAALAFARYLGALHGSFAGGAEPFVASALILAMTALHAVDTVLGGRVQTAFTIGKVALIAVFVVAGLTVGDGSWANFASQRGGLANVATRDFAVSLMYVGFAYSGWNAAAYIAGDIRDPQRTLPLALLLGTGLVMVLYVLVNVAFLYAAPTSQLAGVFEVGHLAARELFGRSAGNLLSSLIALALVSSVSAMVMAGPRVYSAMAADRALPGVLSIRSRRGVPVVAVLAQGAIAVAFVVVGNQRIDALVQYIGFSLTLFTMLAVGSLFIFRARERRGGRAAGAAPAYRTVGYPVTPLLFIGVSLWATYSQFRAHWQEGMLVVATLVVGGIAYAATVGRAGALRRWLRRTRAGRRSRGEGSARAAGRVGSRRGVARGVGAMGPREERRRPAPRWKRRRPAPRRKRRGGRHRGGRGHG